MCVVGRFSCIFKQTQEATWTQVIVLHRCPSNHFLLSWTLQHCSLMCSVQRNLEKPWSYFSPLHTGHSGSTMWLIFHGELTKQKLCDTKFSGDTAQWWPRWHDNLGQSSTFVKINAISDAAASFNGVLICVQQDNWASVSDTKQAVHIWGKPSHAGPLSSSADWLKAARIHQRVIICASSKTFPSHGAGGWQLVSFHCVVGEVSICHTFSLLFLKHTKMQSDWFWVENMNSGRGPKVQSADPTGASDSWRQKPHKGYQSSCELRRRAVGHKIQPSTTSDHSPLIIRCWTRYEKDDSSIRYPKMDWAQNSGDPDKNTL